MTVAPAARVVTALSLLCASLARAEDPASAAVAPKDAATARDARTPAPAGRSDPSKRPPPAVILLPLVGLVLLPLTLPVVQPRARHALRGADAAPTTKDAEGATTTTITTATATTIADAHAAARPDPVPASAAAACATCGDAGQPAADPGARP